MTRASQLSPDLSRAVLHLARALLTAARHWALYPPEHPAVGQSLDRLADAIQKATTGVVLSIGVTPQTLLVEGAPADPNQSIADAAALLHDRDILQLTFFGALPRERIKSFLSILTLAARDRRDRGGPAQIWAAEGHPALGIEQVDYRKVLERDEGDVPPASRRDEVWRSIVMSIASGHRALFDEREQERLLAIAGSSADVGYLAAAVAARKCAGDGSPMITSQAATVLAAFRHLKSIAMVTAPDRTPDVMANIAAAAAGLDPHVVLQVLATDEDPADQLSVVPAMTAAFDDAKVAQLLATALALDGQATDRLATIFNTIAPDDERKHRVLTLTRTLLDETDFGRSAHFHALWKSMEELLVSYNEKPFVAESYRAALDTVGERAEQIASRTELPPELPQWMETLDQGNVRALSVQLLIDLLTLERDEDRAAEMARDMMALAEDLLMSGAYEDARSVTNALADRARSEGDVGAQACRHALDRLGESTTLHEAAALIGDLDDGNWRAVRDLFKSVGVSAAGALIPVVTVEEDTPAARRAADLLAGFGAAVVPRLSALTGHGHWHVQRTGARLLGRIGSAEAVPLLQPLLRKGDPRVAREAIAALCAIPDPAAARAVHTVLRAATGDLRRVVVDALVADRDPRVIPMLMRIVEESQPLGKDHEVVLETLTALAAVGGDHAVPVLARIIRRRGVFGRRKLRRIKERGIDALTRIGSPRATAIIDDASRTGDRLLRKVIAQRRT